jgi:DNA polymerase-3 subunit epsilon
MSSLQPEEMVAALEASGDFRVLRRLQPAGLVSEVPAGSRRAVFLDVETTGLDPEKDEIIELAMVPFYYSTDDEVVGIGHPFSALRQPDRPIPVEVTSLTGIDNAMVAGQAIDPAGVAAFVGGNLVIAHNAPFDRRFLEKFCPALAQHPWACSMSEVRWADEGFESSKLAYLALSSGFYYDRHRAVNDCHAAIELLSRKLPRAGRSALASVLTSARKTTIRCWAENSPFDAKDILKRRGYRWNADDNGQPRAWWIDLEEAQFEPEKAYLCTEIYQRDVIFRTASITAFNRHSSRVIPSE